MFDEESAPPPGTPPEVPIFLLPPERVIITQPTPETEFPSQGKSLNLIHVSLFSCCHQKSNVCSMIYYPDADLFGSRETEGSINDESSPGTRSYSSETQTCLPFSI